MTALELIAAERQRQVEQKGYTPEHDDRHDKGELAKAAASYALVAGHEAAGTYVDPEWQPIFWQFAPTEFKPNDDPERNLVKAGALIVAEIERIQRFRERMGLRRED